MANIKGKATLTELREWLLLIDLGREKVVAAAQLMEANGIEMLENVPDTYASAVKAIRTGAASILAAAEDSVLPSRLAEKKKTTTEAKAGASVAKLIVKTGAQSRGRDKPVPADSGGQTEGKTER